MKHLAGCTCLACIMQRCSDRRKAKMRLRQRMEEIETPLHPEASHSMHVVETTGACEVGGIRYRFGRCQCGKVMWTVPVP